MNTNLLYKNVLTVDSVQTITILAFEPQSYGISHYDDNMYYEP